MLPTKKRSSFRAYSPTFGKNSFTSNRCCRNTQESPGYDSHRWILWGIISLPVQRIAIFRHVWLIHVQSISPNNWSRSFRSSICEMRCVTATFLFGCLRLVMCRMIFIFALCNAITHGCIQFQSLQHKFQRIAQHCNCELMNTEISDIIVFFRRLFGIFWFVKYWRRFLCRFFKLSVISSVLQYTDPWLVWTLTAGQGHTYMKLQRQRVS